MPAALAALLLALSPALGAVPDRPDILVRIEATRENATIAAALDLDLLRAAPGGLELRVNARELAALRRHGAAPLVLDADLDATWERMRSAAAGGAAGPGGGWSDYHGWEDSEALLDALVAAHPTRAEIVEVATTFEGRPVRGLRIAGDLDDGRERPCMLVVGCHHAREWISVEVPLYLAWRLLEEADDGGEVAGLLARGDFIIVPVLNPDGLVHTQRDRWWRKNRRDHGNGDFGVDLNRNYDWEWGGAGSSPDTGSGIYHGAAPFSEPETEGIRALLEAHPVAGGLSYHAYFSVILHPWGWTEEPPEDLATLAGLAATMTAIVNDHHEDPALDYVWGQWSDGLYLATGIFADWLHGTTGRPAILIELPPNTNPPGFLLPPELILPTCVENYPAALAMADAIFGAAAICPADLDRDGAVGIADLVGLLAAWGEPGASDLDGDGATGHGDLVRLLAAWGACPAP